MEPYGVVVRELLSPTGSAVPVLSPSDNPNQYGPNNSNVSGSFRPSIAVITGVLTTMFSLTFLLLLYAKHCKRSPNPSPGESLPPGGPRAMCIADGGMDRSVVEALPVFTFGSLHGMKEGLECAVCLSRFEESDILRLLPKCKHAFHLDCVDTWLVSHSTCPLCRHQITPEDNVAVEESILALPRPPLTPEEAVQEAGIVVEGLSFESAASGRFSHSGDGDAVSKGGEVYARKDGMLLAGGGEGGEGVAVGSRGFFRKSFESMSSPGHHLGSRRALGRYFRRPLPSPESNSRRLGHRIVIADVVLQHRWSDFVPSDVLFLRTQTLFGPEEKARISVSRNEFLAGSPGVARRDSNGDSSFTLAKKGGMLPAAAGSKATHDLELGMEPAILSVGRPKKGGMLPPAAGSKATQDLELGMEPPRLSVGKPTKPRKSDFESRSLPPAVSKATPEVHNERTSKPPRFQRSLSEVAGLDRMAHSRMSSRDLLVVTGATASEVFETPDQEEKSRKWSSIARRTIKWVVGRQQGGIRGG